MSREDKLPRPFLLLSYSTLALGLLSLAGALSAAPVQFSTEFVWLLAAVLISETYSLRLDSYSVSLTLPLMLASIPVAGPAAAALVAAVSSVSPQDIRDKRPIPVLLFNLGQGLMSASAAGWSYFRLGGPVMIGQKPLMEASIPRALIALLAAAVVFNALNMVLLAVGIWVSTGAQLARVFRGLMRLIPTQLAMAFVALLIAQVLAIDPIGLPLFLFPLFLARQVYQSYAALKAAYLDTVRSLVGALEAKDPYTRGHSERVAQYATLLAARTGLDDATIEIVQQSALLHDVGKLSLPATLLTKPDRLTEDENRAMRRHPWVGGEMVARIPALRHLGEHIRSHHERIDGTGYPVGLVGDEVSEIARLLAVADAYDAMTTNRSYRRALSHEDAVAELIRGAGTQFDDSLIRAFIDAGGPVTVDTLDSVGADAAPVIVSAAEVP